MGVNSKNYCKLEALVRVKDPTPCLTTLQSPGRKLQDLPGHNFARDFPVTTDQAEQFCMAEEGSVSI